MSTRTPPAIRSLLRAVLFGALAVGRLGAQATPGTITGRVTDAASGQPIPSAQVNLLGTSLGTQTNDQGQYTLRGVSAGAQDLRALRVGYAEQRVRVSVAAGQTTTQNFQMRAAPVQLTTIVTTATGEERSRAVPNAIAHIDAAELTASAPVNNVTDLLAARAPGVQVLSGVQTGAGSRVRIRGISSLSLENSPIYVIDGVRMESSTGSTTLSVGGTTPSRVGDLNPEEIESIEVVKGPSASTLYGTDAANGVIVITTKRGVAGRPQWTYYTEQAAIRDFNSYPTAYRGWRSGTSATTTSTASNTVQCFLTQTVSTVATTRCTQDSVTSFNLHDDPETTPYGTGYRQQQGVQLRGGSESLRYFVSGEYEDEDGVTKVPEFDQRYLTAHSLLLRPDQESPNRLTRMSGRANLNITLARNADLAVSTSLVSQDLRLPQSDDSGTDGIAANTYGGPGFKYNLNPAGDTLYGWRQFTPRDIYQQVTTQSVERTINAITGHYTPAEWMTLRSNFGLDYTSRLDTQICRFGDCPNNGDNRLGFKRDYRSNFFTYTIDGAGTATHRFGETIESKTTLGVQFYRSILDRNGAEGLTLPPGATQVSAAATKLADESRTESRTLGSFLEENVAIRDRLFLTAAVRSDRNSAFGANFKTVFYPKLAASYVISEEEFFPKPSWLGQLRLRTAYGASGVQPGTTDAVQFYSSTRTRLESGEAAGVVFSTLGNAKLKPERSTELETGFDATFLDGRLSTELTYYKKHSSDALISRILPPSLGTGATSRFENLGEVENTGWETLINAQLLQTSRFGWDVTVNAGTNDNKLSSLGGAPNITLSSTQQHRKDYPLFGWWARPVKSWEDKNGNGIIEYNTDPALSEIVVGDTAEYLGRSLPKYEVSLTNGIDLFQRKLRLSAMFDYRGGHMLYNNTERIRCASRNNCEGSISPQASLEDQARSVAVREHPSRTVGGFIEPADFIRFRELTATYNASGNALNRVLRGRELSISGGVRNLGILWTRYRGVDPEATGSATGNAPSEFQAFGPPTYLTLRLNLGF